MANYPQELSQDAVCQSHTGHITGLWFLPARPIRLNTNEWMNELLHLVGYLYYWQMGFNSVFKGLSMNKSVTLLHSVHSGMFIVVFTFKIHNIIERKERNKSWLTGILRPNNVQVAGLWMKLHYEELHNLYFSSNVIMLFKSAKIWWKRNVEAA